MSAEKQSLRNELYAKRMRLKLEDLFRKIFELNAQVERHYAEIDNILGLNPQDKLLTTEHEISVARATTTHGRLTPMPTASIITHLPESIESRVNNQQYLHQNSTPYQPAQSYQVPQPQQQPQQSLHHTTYQPQDIYQKQNHKASNEQQNVYHKHTCDDHHKPHNHDKGVAQSSVHNTAQINNQAYFTHVSSQMEPSEMSDYLGNCVNNRYMTTEEEIERKKQLIKKSMDKKFHEAAQLNDMHTLEQLIDQRAKKGHNTTPTPAQTSQVAGTKAANEEYSSDEEAEALQAQRAAALLRNQNKIRKQRLSSEDSDSSEPSDCMNVEYRRTTIEEDDAGNEILVGFDA